MPSPSKDKSLLSKFTEITPIGTIITIGKQKYKVCPANNQTAECRSLKQQGSSEKFLRHKNLRVIEDHKNFLDLYFKTDSSFYILHNTQQCIIRCSNKNFADCFLKIDEGNSLLLSNSKNISCFDIELPPKKIIHIDMINEQNHTEQPKIEDNPSENNTLSSSEIESSPNIESSIEEKSNTKILKNLSHPLCVAVISYPARIIKLPIVISSLVEQTIKPDKILIILSEQDFPNTFAELPRTLLDMLIEYDFLEVKFIPYQNLSPRQYYLYAFSLYSDHIIITAEDNTIYNKLTIERLLLAHEKFPNAVCAFQCRLIHFAENDQPTSFQHWNILKENYNTPSLALIHTGKGGVLFPPCFRHNFIFDIEIIQNLAPFSDELWLKICEIRANIPVICVPPLQEPSVFLDDAQEDLDLPSDKKSDHDLFLANILDLLGEITSERIIKTIKNAVETFPQK